MFGPKFKVGWDGFYINLRPFKREEMGYFADMFSSPRVHEYTLQSRGFTQQMEEKWFDKAQENEDVYWAIEPEGHGKVVGSTGIHDINSSNSCHTGIIICDPSWWGKGVASRAHVARTWYALTYLDRATIQSEVMVENLGSRKALERVGYHITGRNPRVRRSGGMYVDSFSLCLISPLWLTRLYPAGLPEEYAESVQKVRNTLDRAKEVVELL